MPEFVVTFTKSEWQSVLFTPEGQPRSDFHDYLVQPIVDWLEDAKIKYSWFRPVCYEILVNGYKQIFFNPLITFNLPDSNELAYHTFDVFVIQDKTEALLFKLRWNEKLYQGKKVLLEMFMYPELAILWATECGNELVAFQFLTDWQMKTATFAEDWPGFIEFLEKSFTKNVD